MELQNLIARLSSQPRHESLVATLRDLSAVHGFEKFKDHIAAQVEAVLAARPKDFAPQVNQPQ